jgi:hypothetical protein
VEYLLLAVLRIRPFIFVQNLAWSPPRRAGFPARHSINRLLRITLDHVEPDPDALRAAGRAAQAQRHVGAGEVGRELRDVDARFVPAPVADRLQGPAAAPEMVRDGWRGDLAAPRRVSSVATWRREAPLGWML